MMKHLGNFLIGERLGEGGMSVVWGGRHTVWGTEAAIKVLRPELANREPHRSAFIAEARAHAKLSHPGILRILDVGLVDEAGATALGGARIGTPFIAMERATSTLEDELPLGGWTPVYGVLLEILDALAHAHARGVVHRDLKPGNVMRVDSGPESRYRLGDFGLAHGRDSQQESSVSMGPTAGTPMYMAPEQINGRWRDFAPETDLYALGCVAFRLVCGRAPFEGESVFQIASAHLAKPVPELTPLFGVPEALGGWVNRLMQKRPHDRFRRAADAAHALREVAQGFDDPMGSFLNLPTPIWNFGDTTLVDIDFAPRESIEVPAARGSGAAGDGLGLFDLTDGPLVGREEESRMLQSALLRARQHRGASVVLLRGPVGVGLSRLARSFARRMDELGLAFVHEATHTPVQAAHEGLVGLLETHFGTWGLDASGVAERVEQTLEGSGNSLLQEATVAVVESISRSRGPHEDRSSFRTSFQRSALLDAALRIGHEDRPRLFFFDDVQWGRESLEFVRDRVEADAQAVFVLTVRDDMAKSTFADAVLAELASAPNTSVIQLSPPSAEAVELSVQSLLEFSPGTARHLAKAAGADFRLARQLVGYLLDVDGLGMMSDGLQLHRSTVLPRDWDELWDSRLAAVLEECELGDEALFGLEIAAELGRFPARAELEDALRIAGESIDPRLHEVLAKKGLVRVRGDAWAFEQQSLVEHLRRRTRGGGRVERYSRACADAIASRPATGDRSSRCAWHLLQGGAYEEAFAPLRVAIRTFTTADPDRASEMLLWWRANTDQLGLERHAPRRIDGLLMEANVVQARGQPERHRKLVERALRWSRSVKYDEGEAWALLSTGQTALDDGGFDFALDRFRRAEAKFRQVGGHEGRAEALFGAAFATMRLGGADASIADYRAAIEIYETIGKVANAVNVMSHLAYSYLVLGDYDAAETLCHRAIDDARRLGDRSLEFESMATLGEVARFRGNHQAARDYLREVVRWRKTLGLRGAALSEFNLALVELGARNFDVAAESLVRCERDFTSAGFDGRVPLVLIALAVAAIGREDPRAWEHFWGRFAPTLQDQSYAHIDVLWVAELGVTLALHRQWSEVVPLLSSVAAEQRTRLNL